uniref:Peptidase M13 C-terminal domain-containing protein n=1 Tax=Strigamia maritima TaxID=126957 RepID=T1IVE7_STRMM
MKENILFPNWARDPKNLLKFYENLDIGPSHVKNYLNALQFLTKKNLNRLNPTKDNLVDWEANSLAPNAFYSQNSNAFFITTAILQLPLFDADMLYAMKYGTMGSALGHEITHGFDLTGTKFNQFGNLEDWLTPQVNQVFRDKSQCFIDQYSKLFITTEEMPTLVQNYYVNGSNTLSENIADNGGLQQAFWAYQKWTRLNGQEKMPDLLREFTPEQLFFLSFSHVSILHTGALSIHTHTYYHTYYTTTNTVLQNLGNKFDKYFKNKPKDILYFSVLGVLANFEEFNKAFNYPFIVHPYLKELHITMLSTGTRIAGRQSTMLLLGIGVATLLGLAIVIFVILYSHLLQPAPTHLNPCNDFYKYSCAWWFGGIPLYGSKTWKQIRVIKNNTKGNALPLKIVSTKLSLGLLELLTNNSFTSRENIKVVFENAKKMYQICTQNWESEKDSGLKYMVAIVHQFHWPIIQSQTLDDSDSIDFVSVVELLGVIHKLGLSDGILDIDVMRSFHPPHAYHIMMNFTLLLEIMFDGKYFPSNEIIVIKNKGYIAELGNLLQETPPRTVLNLLVWYAIEPFLWGTNRALAGINDKINPENHHVYYKRWTNSNEIFSSADKIPRWEKCIEAVTTCFPHTVHQAYVDYFIGKNFIDAISEFTNHIVHTFVDRIDSWNWLSRNAKIFFKQRAEAIKRRFGVTSITYEELVLERSIISKDVLVANLLECRKIETKLKLRALEDPTFTYDPSNTLYETRVEHEILTNSIKVLTGVTQPPFFNPTPSSASNFGALGTLISTALLTIFSSEGIDQKLEYNNSGWVAEENPIYKKLSNCLVNQYNDYCHNKQCRNFGGRTLDNNIANEGGLKLAYMAYKSWITKKPQDEGSKSKLAFVSFSQEQLFFLSFAMMYCANDNPLIIQYLMSYEKQSPPNILQVLNF